jgi:NADPH2:quinone reductase
MARAIQIEAFGGADRLRLVELPVGEPGPGEVRIRHHACGLNYIDVYHRTGLYPGKLPLVLGTEAAGVVEAVGEGVTVCAPGDRVVYATHVPGAYCEVRVMPERHVVRLPDAISFETGAAMMLKGLTVQYLLKKTLPVEGLAAGDFVILNWAAGSVGLIACQRPKALGLRLIGTAGGPEKCRLVREHGAAEAIDYLREDVVARVKELTGGKEPNNVYDSVGKDTFETSLDCLRPFGLLASFGNASGPVPPFSISTLAAKGSLYLTRPGLFTHIAERASREAMAADLFGVVQRGEVKIVIAQRYPLAEAAAAHRDLESRRTTGSTVLLP